MRRMYGGTVIVIVIMTRVQECAPLIFRRDLAYIATTPIRGWYHVCSFQRLLLLLLLKDKRYFQHKKTQNESCLLVLPFCAIK